MAKDSPRDSGTAATAAVRRLRDRNPVTITTAPAADVLTPAPPSALSAPVTDTEVLTPTPPPSLDVDCDPPPFGLPSADATSPFDAEGADR